VVQAILKGTRISIGERHEVMPDFGSAYSDDEVAAVANFVVGHFGEKQGNITTRQVAEQRKQ
jgi:mono/diheme cytochrome c family protein